VEEPGLWLKDEDGGLSPAEPQGWTHDFQIVKP